MPLKYANLQRSEDGSLRSLDYNDIYFQRGQGRAESDYVFLEKNNLPVRFKNTTLPFFSIAELGFGSGLNFLTTAQLWCNAAPKQARLHYISIEKHPLNPLDLAALHERWPDFSELSQELRLQYPPLLEGFHRLTLAQGRICLTLVYGDVAEMLPQISGLFDCWFLDGFSPEKNPAMWHDTLYTHIAAHTKAGGTLSTFSAAGAVRRGLASAGFQVEKTKGYGVKRDMTVAHLPNVSASSKTLPKTAAVIGAGIAGCAAAHALAERGIAVTLYDRRPGLAQEASGNPVGLLYPKLTVDQSPMGMYHSHAFCHTVNLLRRLQLSSWKPAGVLRLDLTDEYQTRSQKLMARQQPPEDIARHVTKTDFGASALYHETAGYLDPREFCKKLATHPHIKTVLPSDISDLQSLPEDIVVIAQSNASSLWPETAFLPLRPLRGQVTYVRETPASQKLSLALCHKGYITPAQEGIHCIGATFQKEPPGTDDVRVTDHRENIETLNNHLPQLGLRQEDVVGGRAAWRATTPDKLPIVGKINDRLYITTGFGAHGLTGAPVCAELLASLILEEPLPIPLDLAARLSPERFKN